MKFLHLVAVGLCISTSLSAAQKFVASDGSYVFTVDDGWRSFQSNFLLSLSRDNAATILIAREATDDVKGKAPEDIIKLKLGQFKARGMPISNQTPVEKLVVGGMNAAQVEIDSAQNDAKDGLAKTRIILTVLRESDTSILTSIAIRRLGIEDKYTAPLQAILESIAKEADRSVRHEIVSIDGQTMLLAYETTAKDESLKEYIPAGQKLDSWTRLAAIREYPFLTEPKSLARIMLDNLKRNNPQSKYGLFENKRTGQIVVDFFVWPPDASFIEFNVFKFSKRNQGGLISEQYAIREYKPTKDYLTGLAAIRERVLPLMVNVGLKLSE